MSFSPDQDNLGMEGLWLEAVALQNTCNGGLCPIWTQIRLNGFFSF
ncbi:MAG: hypothetical protein HC825_08415 [Oscillatoriales cyanobacterium RM1_1_9]|nr:hypothetical protein [Oscillatoriales cyanobacterium SM2_3_0]NJO45924.1 hypothetical protein [Oscillatoriales cyanobacterium RM2_1_1]NJO71693.1 hypothetical protein [Oscillatoriales cyanobacterium RM1_1_9]